MLRVYELMVIFDGDVPDADIETHLSAVDALIVEGGGRVATLDNWGKRRFAYEINHKWDGTYAVLEIVTEATDLDEVQRTLRLADDVVRHKVLRLPEAEATRRGLTGDAAPTEGAA